MSREYIGTLLLECQQSLREIHSLMAKDEFALDVARIHNEINSLRWNMAEKDADESPITGECNSVEKLTAYLNSKAINETL